MTTITRLTHESINPVIAAYARRLIDRMDVESYNKLLVPLLPSLLDTAHLDDKKLGRMCAERAIRVFAPAALRATKRPELIKHAEILETVEIGTADAAWAAWAAAAADAAAAAWAAWAAWAAAAADAAADAWAAWAVAADAAAAAAAAACAACADGDGDWQPAIQLLEDMLAS